MVLHRPIETASLIGRVQYYNQTLCAVPRQRNRCLTVYASHDLRLRCFEAVHIGDTVNMHLVDDCVVVVRSKLRENVVGFRRLTPSISVLLPIDSRTNPVYMVGIESELSIMSFTPERQRDRRLAQGDRSTRKMDQFLIIAACVVGMFVLFLGGIFWSRYRANVNRQFNMDEYHGVRRRRASRRKH